MATVPPRPTPPPDDGRLPWLDQKPAASPAAGTASGKPAARASGSGLIWPVALMVAALIAVGAYVLGRGSQRPVASPVTTPSPLPPARPAPMPVAASPLPAQTAPALARADAEEPRRAPVRQQRSVRAEATGLHLRSEQVRAIKRIAEAGRVAVHRGSAPPRTAYSPRIAASGRVVQLGAYRTVREAEAAAQLFRYKYRGLLATLPKAVLPFRPKGTRRMFYRVQFVVPSQAYAEVTCQRLRAAAKTCIVVY
ncbi:MAG: hypothetical protein ABIQ98_05850 [Sphingomicrobium sp.]